MLTRRKFIRDLMAGRSDSYGHIDIGHSGGGGYGLSSGEGYSSGGYDHLGGGGYDGGLSHLSGGSGGYGHSGGGGYDSGLSHLSGGSGGYGHYEHPISYSHDSYGHQHGASYGNYGKMDCPGIPFALLLTTVLGIGILGFILFTKITAAGRRKRNANDGWSSLLPLEDILKVVDFGMNLFLYLHFTYIQTGR